MTSRFIRAGTFEYARTDSGWEFRPNERTARNVAASHSALLTLLALAFLLACGLGVWALIVFTFVDTLRNDWFAAVMGIGGGLTVIASTPLLIAWSKHAFRKSLRDNWLTMRIALDGTILMGDEILLDAGRARQVVVTSVVESDGEGGDCVWHGVVVVPDRECAALVRIQIPRYGMWNPSVSRKEHAEAFADALSKALGLSVAAPAGP